MIIWCRIGYKTTRSPQGPKGCKASIIMHGTDAIAFCQRIARTACEHDSSGCSHGGWYWSKDWYLGFVWQSCMDRTSGARAAYNLRYSLDNVKKLERRKPARLFFCAMEQRKSIDISRQPSLLELHCCSLCECVSLRFLQWVVIDATIEV